MSNPNPNPKVFARAVLSDLARLRAEVFSLRLRLYQHISSTADRGQTFREMSDEDDKHIQEFYRESLSRSLKACGLSPDPKHDR
jgi:hypothetical protein